IEEGVDNVTVRTVSENIGVSRPALYRHFRGKNHLLCTVAEDGYKRLNIELARAIDHETEDALMRFQGMAVAYVRFAVMNAPFYRLMFGKSVVTRHPTEELQNAARETFRAGFSVVEECSRKGLISGDPVSLLNVAWAMVHGLSVLMIDGQVDRGKGMRTLLGESGVGTSFDSEKIIEFAVNTMITGMKASE
ncbi:MAG: TetR/AcrR family transcriptional regulator, partial [Bacteroidales bacterium]|nr:TetR/AcrR family transcriptional regulator [Candidatus Latescibacterota bacterium]